MPTDGVGRDATHRLAWRRWSELPAGVRGALAHAAATCEGASPFTAGWSFDEADCDRQPTLATTLDRAHVGFLQGTLAFENTHTHKHTFSTREDNRNFALHRNHLFASTPAERKACLGWMGLNEQRV